MHNQAQLHSETAYLTLCQTISIMSDSILEKNQYKLKVYILGSKLSSLTCKLRLTIHLCPDKSKAALGRFILPTLRWLEFRVKTC